MKSKWPLVSYGNEPRSLKQRTLRQEVGGLAVCGFPTARGRLPVVQASVRHLQYKREKPRTGVDPVESQRPKMVEHTHISKSEQSDWVGVRGPVMNNRRRVEFQ